jgi:hypothetical protein
MPSANVKKQNNQKQKRPAKLPIELSRPAVFKSLFPSLCSQEVITGYPIRQVFWLATHPPNGLPNHHDQWHLSFFVIAYSGGVRGGITPLFPIKPSQAPVD